MTAPALIKPVPTDILLGKEKGKVGQSLFDAPAKK